jgi:hypothetical protein
MGAIVNLRTKPDRLREDQAEVLRQALLPFEDGDLAPHVRGLIVHIARQTGSRTRWTFVMLSPDQNAAVVNYLAAHSSRPVIAMRLWALCFRYLDIETGEIMLRRDEIASAVGEQPANVSTIIGELVEFGAISRRREKVGGMRGPGLVRYFMNPNVATHLAGKERDDAQADAPLLRLIETAAPPPAKAKDVVVSIGRPKGRPQDPGPFAWSDPTP